MVGFREALEETARNAFCSVLGRSQTFERLLRRALPGGGLLPPSPADMLYPFVCDRPPPPIPTPFEGGQCPVQYDVVIKRVATTRRNGNPDTDETSTGYINGYYIGPIQGLRNAATPPYSGAALYVKHAGIESFKATDFVGSGVEIIRDEFTISSVTRLDGQPDNCGNPPPEQPPYLPGDNRTTGNVTYINNNGNTVVIPVGIAFGYADVDFNGNFTIPVKFEFDNTFNFNGDFDFNFGNGKLTPTKPRTDPSDPGKPPDPTDPPPGTDPGNPPPPDPLEPDPPEEDDEPKTKKLLRGVIVTSSSPSDDLSLVYQAPNPDLVLPDFGQVQFQIQVGKSLSWTAHTKVQNQRQFIPCPWEYGAVDVKGTPRQGISWYLTPVYVTQTYSDRYPPDEVS